jgi:iron complex outermembrane receptor protein
LSFYGTVLAASSIVSFGDISITIVAPEQRHCRKVQAPGIRWQEYPNAHNEVTPLHRLTSDQENSMTLPRNIVQTGLLVSAGILASAVDAQVLIEEITVTAQKKSQNLQDVGVAVTAFTGEQIEALGWDDSLDVAAQTPGLTTTSNTGDSANIALFSIRGVSQLDFAEGQEAPVALYRDEAYVSSPGASGVPAYDLERIEVLRGPQGTLYGRNATGGLVHFISNKPTEEFEASVDTTVAEYGQLGLTGVVSGPFSESVQGRIAAYYSSSDGYVENRLGDDKRSDDTVSVRGIVNFDLTGESSLMLIGQHTDIDTRGGIFHSRASKANANGESVFCNPGDTDCGTFTADLPPGDNGFFSGGALFDTANGFIDDGDGDIYSGAYDRGDSGVQRKASSITAIYNHAFDNGIGFASVTDYSTSDKEYAEDDDSTLYAVVTYDATADVKQLSQEFRINGQTGKMEWIAGVYYLNIKNDFTGAFAFPSDGYFPKFSGDSDTNTYSAFGQIDFDLSETLLLTAGLRYTQDNKDFVYTMIECDITSSLGLGFCPARLISDPVFANDPFSDNAGFDGLLVDGFPHPFTRKDSETSGKLQLDWQATDDYLFYAGISRGVKGGGFNTPTDGFDVADIAFVGFDPEILTAYELGAKSRFGDGKARLNGSVYYYDYDNFQAFFFADTTSRLINSKAEFTGGEVELTVSPGNGWDFLAGISLLDTTVNGASPGGIQITDQEAPLAPPVTVNGLVRKQWDFGTGASIAAQLAANYADKQYFNVVNAEVTEGGDYTLVDAKVTYFSADDAWELSVFVNNLTDEEPLTYSYDITGFGNYTIQVYGPPRWAGVKFKYNF